MGHFSLAWSNQGGLDQSENPFWRPSTKKLRAYNTKERQALPEGSIDGGTGVLECLQ
jgi:hypothetical protein